MAQIWNGFQNPDGKTSFCMLKHPKNKYFLLLNRDGKGPAIKWSDYLIIKQEKSNPSADAKATPC